MSWVKSKHRRLDGPWEDISLPSLGIPKSEQNPTVWISLAEGATVALVSEGEWRRPEESRYRLFYRRFGEPPVELTAHLLSGALRAGYYDPTQTGANVFADVQHSCEQVVDQLLGLGRPQGDRVALP